MVVGERVHIRKQWFEPTPCPLVVVFGFNSKESFTTRHPQGHQWNGGSGVGLIDAAVINPVEDLWLKAVCFKHPPSSPVREIRDCRGFVVFGNVRVSLSAIRARAKPAVADHENLNVGRPEGIDSGNRVNRFQLVATGDPCEFLDTLPMKQSHSWTTYRVGDSNECPPIEACRVLPKGV
jgi:hypothetical protein